MFLKFAYYSTPPANNKEALGAGSASFHIDKFAVVTDTKFLHVFNVRDIYTKFLTDDYLLRCRAAEIFSEYAIITAYLTHKDNVARNLAKYYYLIFKHRLEINWFHREVCANIRSYRDDLDHVFPELNYGKKYYPCMVREFKKLTYDNFKVNLTTLL